MAPPLLRPSHKKYNLDSCKLDLIVFYIQKCPGVYRKMTICALVSRQKRSNLMEFGNFWGSEVSKINPLSTTIAPIINKIRKQEPQNNLSLDIGP